MTLADDGDRLHAHPSVPCEFELWADDHWPEIAALERLIDAHRDAFLDRLAAVVAQREAT